MTDDEKSARGRFTARGWFAVLAGILVIAAVWAIVRGMDGEIPVLSDAIAPQISESGAFARHRVILRWSALEPGTTYSIRVTDSEGRAVAGGQQLSDPVFRVPADAVVDVEGDRLLWEITAELPDGRRLRSRNFTALLY